MLGRKRLLAQGALFALLMQFANMPTQIPTTSAAFATAYFFVGDLSGTRYFVKSNGDGTFDTMTPFAFGDGFAKGGAAADYDNDGDVDVVTCNSFSAFCNLRKQLSPGVFEDPGTPANGSVFLPTAEEDGAAEDYNQDGHMDFVVSGDSAPELYTADGVGGFTHSTLPAAPGFSRGKDWADYDGDGYPELFVGAAGGTVSLYENTTGTLSGPTTILTLAMPEVTAVASADFDGDGIIDLAVGGGDASGTVSIYIGDGVGGFTHSHDLAPFGSTTSIDNYDFNEDGSQDLVAMPFFAFQPFYVENNGDGTFATAVGLDFTFDLALGIAAPPQDPIRSTVTGVVFNDDNGNGSNDDGLGGLPADMLLSGTDYLGNAVSITESTNVDGEFTFANVPNDNGTPYTLSVSVAPPSANATTTTSRSVPITVANTSVFEEFGYQPFTCTDADGDGFFLEGGDCGAADCDDDNAAINPDATEVCDGVDNECDGEVDEGFDTDSDGFTTCGGDCDDGDADINPDATEACNGIDDNCNAETDEGFDTDADGFTTCGGDCDDEDGAVNPDATEVCNSIDDDCDATVDEGFDTDSDGFTTCGGDCDDNASGVNPDATEICNSIDDNCNELVDEGFDEDGDGFTSCGGDCKDTDDDPVEAQFFLDITKVENVGAGDMTSDIFVGATSFGSEQALIPLTSGGGNPISDPASSADVPAVHVERGVDAQKGPFVRVNMYGHNAQSDREIVTADFEFIGATITEVDDGPNGKYEKGSDGVCKEGKPGQDEFTVNNNNVEGTLCATTNVHSDNITFYYSVDTMLDCSNPDCADEAFAECALCINPGAEDIWGNGVDSNCDAKSCGNTAPEGRCNGQFVASNDAELDSYLADFGLSGGKYKNLKIAYNVNRSFVDIHSPCKITFDQGVAITGDNVCIEGRRGVKDSNGYSITADRAAILSALGPAQMGANSSVDIEEQMRMVGRKQVKIGHDSTIDVEGNLGMISKARGVIIKKDSTGDVVGTLLMRGRRTVALGLKTIFTNIGSLVMESTGRGPQSNALIRQKADVTAGDISITAKKQAGIGVDADVTASGDVTIESTGTSPHSLAVMRNKASLNAASLDMTSGSKAKVGPNASVTTTGNTHIDAPNDCTIASNATVTAGSTSGNCFTP